MQFAFDRSSRSVCCCFFSDNPAYQWTTMPQVLRCQQTSLKPIVDSKKTDDHNMSPSSLQKWIQLNHHACKMVLSLFKLVPCFQVPSQLMTENSHSHSTLRSGYIWSNYDDGTAVIKHQHKMVVFLEIPLSRKAFPA